MNSHSKKVLDRDKTGLMLSQTFISLECCSSVITQFHINIKISVMDYLFQTQDIWVQLLMCNNTKVTCVCFNLFVEMNVTFSISKRGTSFLTHSFACMYLNRCIKWKRTMLMWHICHPGCKTELSVTHSWKQWSAINETPFCIVQSLVKNIYFIL